MTDFLALVVGHALVWAAGIVLVVLPSLWRAGRSPTPDNAPREGELAWTLAAGWFAGALALTLLMRAQSAIGAPFGRVTVALPLIAIVAVGVVLALRTGRERVVTRARSDSAAAWRAAMGRDLPPLQRGAWLALVLWIAVRFGLLLVEVMTRPLYAWDTWMQWATKARVWFELRRIVPFAPFEVWLPANGAVYFDAAPHYPATAPLWQVWSALLIGRWDDAHVNVAWWCTALALCVAVYGFLRGAHGSRLFALLGAWFVASLPMLDVHVALAGYADLPIAAYVTMAALAGWRWTRWRRHDDLALLALFLVALPTLKNPGKAWVVLLLPGVLVGLWPRWGVRAAAALTGAGALALLILAQTSPVILGYRVQFNGSFPWSSLVDAYFLYANWHLLWFGVLAVAVLGARWLLSADTAAFTVTLGLGLLFLLFGFAFTNAAAWVDDQSTVNRATLHLAPLAVVWMLLVYREWSRRLAPTAVSEEASAPTPAL